MMEDNMAINKTRIIFDSKFKGFINKLKFENDEILKQTNTYNYQVIENIQKQIREWVIKSQQCLTLCWADKKNKIDYGANSMPDFFVIFISLLVDLENCHNWNEVYEQFRKLKDNKIIIDFEVDMSDNLLEDENLIISKCLCGHECLFKHMALLSNNKTEIKLWIACDCCEKTGIMTKTEFVKRVRQARPKIMRAYKEKQLEKKFRRCSDCNELKIPNEEPNWKTICKFCYFCKNTKLNEGICLLKNVTV
jgi:hypothetical protein